MQLNNQIRIIFAGGGTGGHLIPAIALAQEFERLHPEVRVRFLIPGKELERRILADHGMPFDECGGESPHGGWMARLRSVKSLFGAFRRSRKLLQRFEPNLVIGVGGYGSVCGGLAARSLKIPLVLMEQNVLAGKVNRFMARFADTTYVQWPLMQNLPGKSELKILGNPIRRNLGRYDRRMALRLLDLNPNSTTLLVMGGSQGASAINRFIETNLPNIEPYHRRLQVIHLTGERDYEAMRTAWAHSRVRHKVLPFASDMGPILAATDVAISRAGATTMSELAAFGKPMILVPLPGAADDHQTHNARYAAAYGAAYHLPQEQLGDSDCASALIREVVLDEARRASMSKACRLVARLDAGKRIALDMLARFGVKPSEEPAENFGGVSSASGRAA